MRFILALENILSNIINKAIEFIRNIKTKIKYKLFKVYF